jgi:hypothetical protein
MWPKEWGWRRKELDAIQWAKMDKKTRKGAQSIVTGGME